jgi:hypothetical protein
LLDLVQSWVRMVLETDDHLRQQGLDDDEFEELGERLAGQRKEIGQLLARGQSQRLLPAMLNFFKLCGVEAVLPAHEQRHACHAFLQAVVTALDLQLRRQGGEVVATEASAAPAPVSKSWREVFEGSETAWRRLWLWP